MCNEKMGELIKVEAGRRPPAGNKDTGGPLEYLRMTTCAGTCIPAKAKREVKHTYDKRILLKTDPQSRPFSSPRLRSAPWAQPNLTALAPTINTPSGLMIAAMLLHQHVSHGCSEFKQTQDNTLYFLECQGQPWSALAEE